MKDDVATAGIVIDDELIAGYDTTQEGIPTGWWYDDAETTLNFEQRRGDSVSDTKGVAVTESGSAWNKDRMINNSVAVKFKMPTIGSSVDCDRVTFRE